MISMPLDGDWMGHGQISRSELLTRRLAVVLPLAQSARETSSIDCGDFGPVWPFHRRWPLGGLADDALDH